MLTISQACESAWMKILGSGFTFSSLAKLFLKVDYQLTRMRGAVYELHTIRKFS